MPIAVLLREHVIDICKSTDLRTELCASEVFEWILLSVITLITTFYVVLMGLSKTTFLERKCKVWTLY